MNKEKEIKIGDWGWFWDDKTELAVYGKLTSIDDFDPVLQYQCGPGDYFAYFSHEHPTGEMIVLTKEQYDKITKSVILNDDDIMQLDHSLDPPKYIGKEMRGFGFDGGHNGVYFSPNATRYIDRIGLITEYSKLANTFHVVFDDGWSYWYPADLAGDHIINTKPQPEYEPFTLNDAESIIGKLVKFKSGGMWAQVIECDYDGFFFGHGGYRKYREGLSDIEFIDGTPFGKLKKYENDKS